jgi:hypothetical protein
MTPPDPTPDADGLHLLSRRTGWIAGFLQELGDTFPDRHPRHPVPGRIVATGIGSSEAHARYLVWLLNRTTTVPAEFAPLGSFGLARGWDSPDRALVVFSQGLSANARMALSTRHRFAHRILFTASTPDGLRASGKPDRAAMLESLAGAGTEIVPFPLEDEYTVLIRVIGPALGFLAARLWTAQMPGSRLEGTATQVGRVAAAAFLRGLESGAGLALRMPPEGFPRGLVVPVSPCLSEFAQNLSCKFVEGLFQPAPAVMDLLQFAHGPFQQLTADPRPVLVLHREDAQEEDLLGRIRTLCQSVGIPCLHASTGIQADPELGVLEAEGLLAPTILSLACRLRVNQVEWPGKGLDGPLYLYSGPTTD